MGQVVPIAEVQTKTEQRVVHIINLLKSATGSMTYDEIRIASGATRREADNVLTGGIAYDMLLFVMTTLIELGYVERSEVIEGKGHPRYLFRWIGPARVPSTRKQVASR